MTSFARLARLASLAYGARSPRSHYDVTLIVTSVAILSWPRPALRTNLRYVITYGHITTFNI